MQIFITHPTGNRNVRAIAEALFESQMLAEFGTTIAINADALWLSYVPAKMKSDLLRRNYPIPPKLIWTNPLRELARMILPKLGLKGFVEHEKGWACVDAVYNEFDYKAAQRVKYLFNKKKIDAVYCYEDGALETFKVAKKLGLKCIYDLPIAYWETGRSLMQEEAKRLPDWASTLGGGIKDSARKLERKVQELELADIVVTSGNFVKNSLPEFARKKKIIVSPFGSPSISTIELTKKRIDEKSPLRVLFVGSMGQRKGLGDLFEAMKLLHGVNVELIVMGTPLASMEFYKKKLINFTYEPGRPNHEVLALMRTCDVFCLPSIVEGRALVMQEAMSQGLPLIITPNTGGDDLIIEGKTGFLVPIRSPESIANKIKWFVKNREQTYEMGQAARLHAMNYTWRNYSRKIVDLITE